MGIAFGMQGQSPLEGLLQFAGPDGWAQLGRVWWILLIALNVALAIGVALHANGKRTALVPRWIWMFLTLVHGVLGVLAYWVVNVSRAGDAAKR